MDVVDRLERLERIALNQTVIIDQLTAMVRELSSPGVLNRALDKSAEQLLELIFRDSVPVELLDLAIDWRKQLASPQEVMLTS